MQQSNKVIIGMYKLKEDQFIEWDGVDGHSQEILKAEILIDLIHWKKHSNSVKKMDMDILFNIHISDTQQEENMLIISSGRVSQKMILILEKIL